MNYKLRDQVLTRDNNQCQLCETTQKRLDVHHIIKRKFGGRDVLENLLSLCRSCHAKLDKPTSHPIGLSQLNVRMSVQLKRDLKLGAIDARTTLEEHVCNLLEKRKK